MEGVEGEREEGEGEGEVREEVRSVRNARVNVRAVAPTEANPGGERVALS